MDPCKDFFREKECFLETICSYMMAENEFQGYYCEELERLRKEDVQKGTEFYESLKQYLLSGNNVGMAAQYHDLQTTEDQRTAEDQSE